MIHSKYFNIARYIPNKHRNRLDAKRAPRYFDVPPISEHDETSTTNKSIHPSSVRKEDRSFLDQARVRVQQMREIATKLDDAVMTRDDGSPLQEHDWSLWPITFDSATGSSTMLLPPCNSFRRRLVYECLQRDFDSNMTVEKDMTTIHRGKAALKITYKGLATSAPALPPHPAATTTAAAQQTPVDPCVQSAPVSQSSTFSLLSGIDPALEKDPNNPYGDLIMGFLASKRQFGKRAVDRNRARRRVKEAARRILLNHLDTSFWYVVVCKSNVNDATYEDLCESLEKAREELRAL